MKKIWVLLLLILVGCAQQQKLPTVAINNINIIVEVADTQDAQMQGLMYREELERNHGMLFVFADETPRTFWMKNTKIPLDMIHINANHTVVDIITAQPCVSYECETYPSQYPAQYVLEVNAGFAEKNKIIAGMQAEFDI